MRKNILMMAGALAVAATAQAQYTPNYASPTYSLLASRDNLYAFGDQDPGTFCNGVVDFESNGNVLYIGDISGDPLQIFGTGLLRIVDNSNITQLTGASDAAMLPLTEEGSDPNNMDGDAAAIFQYGGDIYFFDREDTAEILLYDVDTSTLSTAYQLPTSGDRPAAFSGVYVYNGFLYMAGGDAETGIYRMDMTNPAGGFTKLKNATDYDNAVTGSGTDLGVGCVAGVGDKMYIFDDTSFNGATGNRVLVYDITADTLAEDSVALDPSNTVVDWETMAGLPNGDIIVWNDADNTLYLYEPGVAVTQIMTNAALLAGIGAVGVSTAEVGGLTARHAAVDSSTGVVEVVFANSVSDTGTGSDATNRGNVYKVSFPTVLDVSAVPDWATFE